MMDEELQAAVEQHRQGGVQAAAVVYERILARDPEHATALRYLGLARFQLGDRRQGLECLRRATKQAPHDAAAWSDLGRMHAVLNDMQEATACFRRSIAADPGHADAWHNLGAALRQSGDQAGALEAYKRALALDPGRAGTYLNIGNLLIDDNQPDNAIESYRRAAALDPRLPQARASLGAELSSRGEVSEAEFVYRQAIALNPDHVQAWFGLGRTLEDLGRAAEAAQSYRRVLALDHQHSWALGQLLSLDAEADDSLLASAKRALQDAAAPDRVKSLIGYGLGKALDRRQDYDGAFAAFRQANAARRREAGAFDAGAFELRIQRLIDTFTPAFFEERAGGGPGTDLPLFIIGMPRSGTTLTEQILDCHPQVFGAGELPHLAELAAALPQRCGLDSPWPECAVDLGKGSLYESAYDYLEKLRSRAPAGVLRITDKSPLNFYHLGLAVLLFANARVIHCRRNPIDTCLSIYFENFRGSQTYATDLDDITTYYRGYQRLMAHWQRVLPLPMLELQYEQMVAGLEESARALLAFVRLPWDDRCLDFHASGRAVQTPSRWQVRKPIYSSSVARWRRYERYLEPLIRAFPQAVD
jgi:tetratricopeptide (TPR) repeat protein